MEATATVEALGLMEGNRSGKGHNTYKCCIRSAPWSSFDECASFLSRVRTCGCFPGRTPRL